MTLTTNLGAYWKLDGNSNDSIASNNGTDTNITYSAGNGKIVQGAGYNGSSSAIALTGDSITKPTGNWTIAGWFKDTGDDSTQPYFFQSYSESGADYAGIIIAMNTEHDIILNLYKTTTGTGSYIGGCSIAGTFNDSNWHYISAKWDGTTYSLKVDNGTASTLTSSTAVNYRATSYQRIGATNFAGTNTRWWTGAIDEVGIWSRALSDAEETELYNAGVGLAYPFISGPANLKSWNGLAKASIKSVNGLAIASIKSINNVT